MKKLFVFEKDIHLVLSLISSTDKYTMHVILLKYEFGSFFTKEKLSRVLNQSTQLIYGRIRNFYCLQLYLQNISGNKVINYWQTTSIPKQMAEITITFFRLNVLKKDIRFTV